MPNFFTINSTPINGTSESSVIYDDIVIDGISLNDTHGMFRPAATFSNVVVDGILVDDTHELFRIPTTYSETLTSGFSLDDTHTSHIVSIFDDIYSGDITTSDSVVGHIQQTFNDTLTGLITVDDLAEERGQLTFNDILVETNLVTQAMQGTVSARVLEALSLMDQIDSTVSILIVENLSIVHTSIWGSGVIVNDGLQVSGQVTLRDVFAIVEGILIAQQSTYATSFNIKAEEIITLADSLLLMIAELVSEDITLNASEGLTLGVYMKIKERVLVNHSEMSSTTFNILLSNVLTLVDYLNIVAYADVAEELLLLSDEIGASFTANLELIEALQIIEAPVGKLVISILAEEQVLVGLSDTNSMVANSSLLDGIQFILSYDDGENTYMGITMSPESFGITEYDNYNFTDSTLFQDDYLFSNPEGLFLMGGSMDEDEYITSKIKTASIDFDTSNIKQVPKVYLGIANDSSLILRVAVDGSLGATYELELDSDNLTTQMIDIGKGLKGRYWQFELQTRGNTQFNLDELELYPIVFGRKI